MKSNEKHSSFLQNYEFNENRNKKFTKEFPYEKKWERS